MTAGRLSRRGLLLSGAGLLAGSSPTHAQDAADIRILVPNTLLGATAQQMANRFTEMTGATVRFLTLPPETIEFRLREDVRTGANLYHGAIVSMWHLGGYVVDNIILPIDDLIPATETPGSSDAEFPAVSQLRSLEDRQYALPIDGDCQLLYFQNDILESDEIAAAFQSETGREWSIPGTWTDLIAMATWWSARGQNGVALGLAPVSMAAFPFLAMAAPYATPVDDPGLFWFSREDFTPRIDSGAHQTALQDFAALAGTGDTAQWSWHTPEAWLAFLDGEALFTIAGPDLLTSAIDWGHARRDRIGVAPLPASDQPSGTPIAGDRAFAAGNVLGPNWGGVIQANAPDPELTFQFLALLSDPVFQRDRGWTVDDGIDPSRAGQLPGVDLISLDHYTAAGFTETQASQFGDAIAATLGAPVQLPYLRIPGAFDYLTALDNAITGYLAGAFASPAAALQSAAAAFAALSTTHGVERQHHLYFSNLV
ncbi:MAG: extracellular solute-binding protein [Thermomicrobiales bacterium]|nr:extracellular solute-binding protein [Thermomicrobiales bacterium]